ncbi:hypothetical protein IWQ60_009691 [Tieghemiomyces parasiticus]|uniref:Uncharacterized protein n=1 Tax=Tieghemiomyces parasiticus TaxID=78921 RepID=A0A9W7ZT63_9FUNG|nr:hypothetical protein IWQ60_009691 [Tieghemiomyces parasiticus]
MTVTVTQARFPTLVEKICPTLKAAAKNEPAVPLKADGINRAPVDILLGIFATSYEHAHDVPTLRQVSTYNGRTADFFLKKSDPAAGIVPMHNTDRKAGDLGEYLYLPADEPGSTGQAAIMAKYINMCFLS